MEDVDEHLGVECAATGQHFIEDAAERKDVGAWVERAPLNLLGRHVADRADHHPLLRLPALGLRLLVVQRAHPRADDFGEPEIEHLGVAVAGDHDVLRLQIAMHDAGGMRFLQRVRDLGHVLHQFPGVALLSHDLAQRGAVDQLRDDVVRGAPVTREPALTDAVDGEDVRMIEAGDDLGLALESRQGVFILLQMFGENLDGHEAIEARIARAIHLPHTARPERRDHLVVPELGSAGNREHVGSWTPGPAGC